MTAVTKDKSKVAFLGLGNIGSPMALRLIDEGWKVVAFDPVGEKVAPMAERGAEEAKSLDDVFACDVLVLAVPDDTAVEEIVSGPGGYFKRGTGPRTVVVHSTILPATAQRLAVEAEASGVAFIDAPVSGGASRAIVGELTVFLGAAQQALEDSEALIASVASTVEHVGEAGAGAATKLANQLMLFAAASGVYEGLSIAQAYGVEKSALLKAVSTSTGSSWVTDNWGFFDETSHAYQEAGTPLRDRPWSKDLVEVLLAARAADLPVPVAGVLSQTVADYIDRHSRSGE